MKQYEVTGMSCAACQARVEKAVSKVPGVTGVAVSLLTNSMGVEGDADSRAVIEAVVKAGYGASLKTGKSGKPAAIAREIGKRPVLAFGNSSGDYSMLNYAEGNPDHAGMGVLIVCDDTVREYGSEEKAADFYAETEKQGWTAFSMANDWLTIYGEGVEKTGLPGAEEPSGTQEDGILQPAA